MLKYLIGNNSVGKTKYLTNLYEAEKNCSRVATNLTVQVSGAACKLDEKVIEILKHLFLSEVIVVDGNVDWRFCGRYNFSFDLLNILNILIKDVDLTILDAPDCNLAQGEIYFLSDLLRRIAIEHNSREIIVSTHSSFMLSLGAEAVFVLENNKLVPAGKGYLDDMSV